MSVQFGRWNFDGLPPSSDCIEKVDAVLAAYGPDSNDVYSKGGTTILYRAFHTTKESHRERQPHICSSRAVITWDGRLDNRAELIGNLRESVGFGSTDVAIVSAAYEKWGTGCFAQLIGDWAVSVWNPVDCQLILAKDPLGTRPLYYSIDADQITWCTVLVPLTRLSGKSFALNEEYVAGWLSILFPAAHLTPYVGIHSVPPSSSVFLSSSKHVVNKYWEFSPEKKIRYRNDAEYEEHFRAIFAESVQRRLRSDRPVLAELSGGRDSSSIVCMADTLMARGTVRTPRLDTVSWYDDSEPQWNERRYFTKVEEKRGRTGWHIDVGAQQQENQQSGRDPKSPGSHFAPIPGCEDRTSRQMRMCVASQGNRVVLSGIGGDEIMGGVPTPTPELSDLLARAQFGTLAHQLRVWALQKRRPWFHLFWEVIRGFFPPEFVGVVKDMRPAAWLQSNFVKHHWAALTGYPSRLTLFGALPSFQYNLRTINALRRQLACTALPFEPPLETRYPYLDRNLVEFMFAVPREQFVRPAQRRSLMRRALVGIVPDEILNRKTKGFVSRSPLVAISKDWISFVEMTQHMVTSSLGLVDSERISDVLQKARHGEEVRVIPLMRTIHLEGWLRSLLEINILDLDLVPMPEVAKLASIRRQQQSS